MEVRAHILPEQLNLPPQYVVPSPGNYFTLPTTMAAVGPRGGGKTYNFTIWNQWMFEHGYFTRFYVISPTYESNPCLKLIPTRPYDVYTDPDRSVDALNDIVSKVEDEVRWYETMTNEYAAAYRSYVILDRNISKMDPNLVSYMRGMQKRIRAYYDELEELNDQMEVKELSILYTLNHKTDPPSMAGDMSYIGSRYEDLHPWFYPPVQLIRPVPLLFLDDLSHSSIYSVTRKNPLINLFLRHRHLGGQGYGLSIQYAVQVYKGGGPKALRANTMQFLLFGSKDKNVEKSMYEELGGHCTEDEFRRLYEYATSEPHGFLLVDNNCSDPMKRFRKGWDTFLVNFTSERDGTYEVPIYDINKGQGSYGSDDEKEH